jgi:UDP-3-O-[3-hydroxymyristoyl] glucosamine N-acyltransferase
MPKPLVLIGCRNLMDFWVDTCEILNIPLLGFVDRYYYGNTDAVDNVACIGNDLDLIENPKKFGDVNFMIATTWDGNTRFNNIEHDGYHLRQEKLQLVKQANLPLTSLVDPRAVVPKSTSIGAGTYVGRFVNMRTNNTIGTNCFIHDNAIIAHDVQIGDNCILGIAATIMGGVHIGNNVYVGTGALLVNGKGTKQPFITVGDDCKIHAGALVQKDMLSGTTATFVGKYLRRTDIT